VIEISFSAKIEAKLVGVLAEERETAKDLERA